MKKEVTNCILLLSYYIAKIWKKDGKKLTNLYGKA